MRAPPRVSGAPPAGDLDRTIVATRAPPPGTGRGEGARDHAPSVAWRGHVADRPRPQGQRSLLVRQRPQVQAVPQGQHRARPARAGSARRGRCRPRSPGRPTPRPASRCARPGPHVRTPDVIERMRVAGRAAAEILQTVGAAVAPGVTTDELDALCHDECIKRGGYPSPLNYGAFPKSLCTSVNEVICHGIPDDRALIDGDIVNLDVTIFLDGVHGDTNATFPVGRIDEASARAHPGHPRVPRPGHRRRAAGPPGPRDRPRHPDPRRGRRATGWCGRSWATASPSSSTPTCRSRTTTTRGPPRSSSRA